MNNQDRCGQADHCLYSDLHVGTKKSCCLGDREVTLPSKTFSSQIIALGVCLSCEAVFSEIR